VQLVEASHGPTSNRQIADGASPNLIWNDRVPWPPRADTADSIGAAVDRRAFWRSGEGGENLASTPWEDDMRRLAEWPVLGVVLVCITWVLLTILIPLLWMIIQMRRQMARLERTGGVEAMAVQDDGLIVLLPPLVFCVAWLFARHRARRAAARREVRFDGD